MMLCVNRGYLWAIILASAMTLHGQTGTHAPVSTQERKIGASNADSTNGKIVADDENRGWLQPGQDPNNRLVSPFLKHIVSDQKQFWTSPAHFRTRDLKWILPAAGITAAFIASDSWWAKQVNPSHMQTSLHISDYGTYALIGLGGASFLFGHATHNDHLQETGLLSGEAAINSNAVTYLFKEITQRQRPLEGNGHGD